MSPRKSSKGVLGTLEFSNTSKLTYNDTATNRRNKLLERLDEQYAVADAMLQGKEYKGTKLTWQTNDEGERERVAVAKRIKKWFYTNDGKTWYMQVRYGNKALELAAGKKAVVIGEQTNILPTITKLKEAVEAKELDEAIAAVAKLKSDALRGYKGDTIK